MKKLLTVLVAMLMLVTLAGCSSSSNNTASTTTRDTTVLNIWMSSEPDHLDPALNSSVDGGCLATNTFEGLYRYNADGELEPACAESYTLSEDGLVYTFTMRDGLKWSNGEALDASDFEYSWKRAASPELAADYSYLCEIFGSGFSYETGLADSVVKASEDGKTLTVTFESPCPYFLDLCAFPFFFPVYEEEVEATVTTDTPAGTSFNEAGFVSNGAFTLQTWNHESDMVYVKNENYWDADTVSIETMNVMLTSNDVSAYTAYQNGDLDFIDSVPTDELATAMTSDEFKIIDELGTYYVGFNYNSELYAKLGLDEEQAKVFRHAISLLIDRQYICDAIGQTGQVPANTFIPAAAADGNGGIFEDTNPDGYYNAGLTEDAYDANVQEAKELLASIGLYDLDADALTKDVTFTYLTNNSEGHVKIAEAIQADMATIGITMQIEQEEWNVFLNTRKNGDFDVAREGWVMDYNDPINMLEMWLTDSGNNDMQFGRDDTKDLDWDKYDDLIAEIRVTTDLAKRAELMHEAEDMLMETWCVVPVYYYNDPYMVKDNVTGIYGTALGMKYFYHATVTAE